MKEGQGYKKFCRKMTITMKTMKHAMSIHFLLTHSKHRHACIHARTHAHTHTHTHTHIHTQIQRNLYSHDNHTFGITANSNGRMHSSTFTHPYILTLSHSVITYQEKDLKYLAP